MTTKRIRKKRAKRMPATKQAQTRRPPSAPSPERGAGPLCGDEVDPMSWVTPGAAEGDRATVEEDLAERDKVND